MLTVKEMIERIRAETHDEQENGYSDEYLIHYLNDGIRFLRRTIFTINPMLLVNMEQSGTLKKDDDAIELESMPSHICSVRVGGSLLEQVNPLLIDSTAETGQPTHYYLQGLNKIRFYPAPDAEYDYEVLAIKDVTPLKTMDDKSPFPDDFDDWLFEYATTRASMTNEFDMSQESTVMQAIVQQVEQALYSMAPIGIQTDSYMGSSSIGYTPYSRYRRRRRWYN